MCFRPLVGQQGLFPLSFRSHNDGWSCKWLHIKDRGRHGALAPHGGVSLLLLLLLLGLHIKAEIVFGKKLVHVHHVTTLIFRD